MEFYEKTIKSETIFEGRIIKVRKEYVKLPSGIETTRELISHNGGVGIVPIDAQGNVYMVRQFRKPIESTLLEIPAGKLEKGEDTLECAKRELEEETGFIATDFTYLGYFLPTPGYCDEKIYIYMAQGLEKGTINPDEDEIICTEKYPLSELVDMILNGEIKDGKTIIGILKSEKIMQKNNLV